MGTQSPFPKRGGAPQFSAHVYCGQTAAWIKMPLGMEVFRQPTRHCVRWGPSSPPLNGHSQPLQFSAIVRCGQTAGCTKMPLGTEVGLRVGRGLRDIVFDVDPATPRKRAEPPPPNFWPRVLWPNSWIDEDAAWYGSTPRPGHIVLDGVPAPAKGAQQLPPSFLHMCIVATVAHLSYC